MNKQTLAEAVSAESGVALKDVHRVLNALYGVIIHAVKRGEEVSIFRFGKFQRVHRPARTARNPVTGDSVDVPDKHVPMFRAAANFRTEVHQ